MPTQDELEDMELDAAFEGGEEEGSEPVVSLEDKPVVAAQKKSEDDDELEITPDARYAKKDWAEDPAKAAEDPDDANYKGRVKKRIGKLTAAVTEATRQRDIKEAESQEILAFARAQAARAAELEKQLASGSATYYETLASRETQIAELAVRESEAALSKGDASGFAAASRKATEATIKAENAKVQAAHQKTQSERTVTPAAPPVVTQQRPAVTERTQAWLQKNPWFNGKPAPEDRLSTLAISAHNECINLGIRPDTDEYFSHIDKSLADAFPEKFGKQRAARAANPPTTMSSRQSPTLQTTTQPKGKLVLTQSQYNAAQRLGFTTPEQLKAYAREVAASKGAK